MAAKKQIPLNKEEAKKRFTDEGTGKRNHEHLTNENDEITEQDISNVKTNVTMNNDERFHDDDEVDDKLIGDDLEAEKVKDNSDTDIDTSWNILGE